jgi:general stress protein 26
MAMSTPLSQTQERQHFISLLRKFRSAMLVTCSSDCQFHARPMAIAEVEEDGCLWFITVADTAKVHEIEGDSHAALTAQGGEGTYLSLNGRATLVDDPAKIADLWKESFLAWFPGGKNDPSLELIRVRPERGEYWDHIGQHRASYLWESAISYVSGAKPEVDRGDEHGFVSL